MVVLLNRLCVLFVNMHALILLHLHTPWKSETTVSSYMTFATLASCKDLASWDNHLGLLRIMQVQQDWHKLHMRRTVLHTLLCISDDGSQSWAHIYSICATVLLSSYTALWASVHSPLRHSRLYDCSRTETCISSTACCYMPLHIPDQASHGWAWTYQRKRNDYTFWCQFNEKPSIIPGCPRGHTTKTIPGWPGCTHTIPWYLRLSLKTLRIAWLQQDWDMQLWWCNMFCICYCAYLVKPSQKWKM